MWEMVYGQDNFQATPYQEKATEKKLSNDRRKINEKIMKFNDHWNNWKFQLHWNNIK